MELSAFAWLFSLYCRFLVIPANRIDRENTKRSKTYVWYLHRPQMSVISKLKQCQTPQVLHFAADSSSSDWSWLLPRWARPLDKNPSAPATKGFSHLKNIRVTAGAGWECEWKLHFGFCQKPIEFFVCRERKHWGGKKKKSMNRAERTNSLGARFLQKRSMGTICQAVHWNTGLNSAHLDIPPLKYLHMFLGVSNVSLNWGL